MEKIFGVVEEIIYKNEDNGFAVILLDVLGEAVSAAGNLPFIAEGESVILHGQWFNHPKFGEQFSCEYYEPHFEKNTASIYKFLSGGILKGVGGSTAKKIVDYFLEETLNIIELSPERLAEIPGISFQKAMNIHKEYIKKIDIQNVVTYFNKYGVAPSVAVRVYNTLGGMAIKLCDQNPYIICERVENIGFLTADNIAGKMGVSKNAPERIKAGIVYELHKQSLNGHSCYPKNELLSEAARTLDISLDLTENPFISLIIEQKIVDLTTDGVTYVFLPNLFQAEKYIAGRILFLSGLDCEDLSSHKGVAVSDDIELCAEQEEAVSLALKNNVLIITGGPGTGKTTVIKSLIRAFSSLNKKIFLTAPTGRAAKRIAELTGYEAKTIHRLLEISYQRGAKPEFMKNERSPLDCDVLIIDEMSMTDSLLFEAVLRAVKAGTRLVMVGDCDQLPSVGAGNILKDLISGNVKRVSFSKIFRQNDTSMIVENAHRILNGHQPIYNAEKSDFFFVSASSGEIAAEKIKELFSTRLPGFLKTGADKIQLLTPMRKTALGSVSLNNMLKSLINPVLSERQPQKQYNGYTFSLNDRVMQTKNDYEIDWITKDGVSGTGIYNGDMGIINEIDLKNGEMTILFDDEKIVKYDFFKLDNLELAYAITVHKSQGSEFDAVIIPLVYGYSKLMTKNLLYTAVTRAKSFVCVVGRKECVSGMIKNDIELKRYTGLTYFLQIR